MAWEKGTVTSSHLAEHREIRATTISLILDGLEQNIDHQKMADLINYIRKNQYEFGTESASVGHGVEVYEEVMLHLSLRPENPAPTKEK